MGIKFKKPPLLEPLNNHLDEIKELAHKLYLERAGQSGDEVTDWVKAEQEIRKKYKRNQKDYQKHGKGIKNKSPFNLFPQLGDDLFQFHYSSGRHV